MARFLARVLVSLLLVPAASGCRADRYFEITSKPSGAEVRLDDELVGVTPIDHLPFEHYGTRRMTFRLPGYHTATRRLHVRPHWYARFPLDLVTEVLLPFGLRDRRRIHEELVEGEEVMSLPSLRSVIERARALRQAGPDGPRDLPEVHPEVVPSEPEPEPRQGTADAPPRWP